MPIVQAIQLKLSLQTTGEEAIKRFTQQIQELAKMPVKINLESQFQTSAQSLTTAIEKQMPNIANAIAEGVAKAIDDVSSRIKQMFGELETDAKKKQGMLAKILVGDNLQTTAARALSSFAIESQLVGIFEKVQQGTTLTKVLFGEVQSGIMGVTRNYAQRVMPMFMDSYKKMAGITNIIRDSNIAAENSRFVLNYFKFYGDFGQKAANILRTPLEMITLFGHAFRSIATSMTGFLTVSGYFFFSGMFFKEATIFIQRFLGIQHQLTLLERINRIVMTIDKALHSIHLSVGSIFKSAGIGLVAFSNSFFGLVVNPFNTIITKLAFANSIVNVISSYLEQYKLRFLGLLGDGTAKIRLALGNIKEFVFRLTYDFNYMGGGLVKKGVSIMAYFGSHGAKLQLAILKYREFFMYLANQLPKIMTTLTQFLNQVPNAANKVNTLQKTLPSKPSQMTIIPRIDWADVNRQMQIAQKKILALPAPIVTKATTSTMTATAKAIPMPGSTKPLLGLPSPEDIKARQQAVIDTIKQIQALGMKLSVISTIIGRNVGNVSDWIYGKRPVPHAMQSIRQLQQLQTILQQLQLKKTLGGISEGHFLRYALGIPKEIALGIQSNPTILKQAMEKALKPVDDSLPHSPAKIGPLRFLRASGKSILTELAIGMNSNLNVAQNAVTKVAKAIARFFPHSPAEEGPLRGLRQWGQGILSQLSLGISDKLASLLGMFFNLANQIKATLKPIIEMSFIGERMGVNTQTVSLLEYAFAGFEVQASEVQMTMQSLNRTLAEVATPEKLSALAQVGINLQQVRQAANPTMELFKQLSNAMNRFPLSSDKMIKALEAIGMSTQSNLINAMAQGWPTIEATMNEGVKMGAAYDESFVKAGHSFTELMNKISKVGEILEREFALTLMPVVDGLFRKVFNFYQENASEIRAVVRVAGQAIGILIETISKVVAQAWQNPTAFKDAILGILTWLYQSAGELWNAFLEDSMSGITSHVWLFLKHTVVGALDATKNMVFQLIELAAKKMSLAFISKIKEVVGFLSKFNLLKIFGVDFSENIESLFDPLTKLAEDADKSAGSFTDTLWKVADENAKIMEEARKASAIEWKNLQDPEAIKRTTERFSQAFNEITSRFQGSLQGTGFDKILAESADKLKSALSQENFAAAQGVLEDVNQKMQRLNEGVVEVGKNAVEGANKAGDAAKNAVDGFKNGLQTAERETKNLTDKIQSMLLDMRIRVAKTDSERNKAQEQKDLLDLKAKHSQELIEFEKLLHAKYLLDEQYAKLSFEEQAKYIKDLDEYKEFIESQGIEKPKVVDKNDQKDQQEFYQNWTSTFDNLGSAFGNMYELMGEKVSAFFFLQKGIAIAQAIVNTALSITKALAEGGPILGPIMAGTAAAAGATQVAVITAQTIQGPTGMAMGGTVPGTGNKDTIPIMATPGEFILPKQATSLLASRYGASFLEGLRQGVINLTNSLPSPKPVQSYAFATGGPVSMPNFQQSQNQAPINIVNLVDPNDIERYLGSARGQKMVLNIIHRNNREIQRFNKG